MPYVPSKKTNPPAQDREILDPFIDALAEDLARKITDNKTLSKTYTESFYKIGVLLRDILLSGKETSGSSRERALAEAIYDVSQKYGYWGAHLGELNYSITRLIQRVPQIKVARGEWKDTDELRYWLYASTVSALTRASRRAEILSTEILGIDIDGVFEDIKDEYKWKVNRPYEIAQVLKSGDAYDTPFYMKVIELVDEDGNVVGHQEVALKRSSETTDLDLLPWQIVVRKKIVKKDK